ncbi:MAG TPA: calcium/proton exchanger [Pyrinomonadaceae bacterium]|jgi:Ca2+:H+ antiporter|nr:calcium/proton exchanger [Pyrinomonadaceae bacterium]
MIFTYLLLLIPLSLALHYFGAPPLFVFISAALSIIPLAEWIRRATEQVAEHAGSVIGGLLNVTFGNSAELILAIFVLSAGNTRVVKATITGSIIGNSLFGLGLAILVGSWGRAVQTFKRERAGLLTSLLLLAVIALMIPALFDYAERGVLRVENPTALDEHLSLGVAVVLILVYAANLVYTLITHRDIFAGSEEEGKPIWSMKRSLLILLGATAIVALMAELVSGALEETAGALHLTPFFLGIIVLPLVGNAAEYFSAVYFASQDRMGLVMNIAVGASIQMALLTAPILVLLSYVMGHPMDLVFHNPLELIALAAVAFVVNSIAQDGETTWFEGLLLIAVYTLLALAFFFISP